MYTSLILYEWYFNHCARLPIHILSVSKIVKSMGTCETCSNKEENAISWWQLRTEVHSMSCCVGGLFTKILVIHRRQWEEWVWCQMSLVIVLNVIDAVSNVLWHINVERVSIVNVLFWTHIKSEKTSAIITFRNSHRRIGTI